VRGRLFAFDPVNFVAADRNIAVLHAKFPTVASPRVVFSAPIGFFQVLTLDKR
jgi:hypothetical protein